MPRAAKPLPPPVKSRIQFLERKVEAQAEALEIHQQIVTKITKGQTPAEVWTGMGLPTRPTSRQVTEALQRYIAHLAVEHHAVEVLVSGLYSPDAHLRKQTASELLSKVVPNLKAVEMVHAPDERTAQRQERAVKVLEEIMAQGRLRLTSHSVIELEPEDAEIVP